MEIKKISANNFANLKEPWETLQHGADMTAFQTYCWYFYVNEHFLREHTEKFFAEVWYYIAYDASVPVMIAPIKIIKATIPPIKGMAKGCHILGEGAYSDYLSFIYQDFNSNAANRILLEIKKDFNVDKFYFHSIMGTTAMYPWLCTFAKETHKGIALKIELPEQFDNYLAMLSKSVRQNIRTANNRAYKNNMYFHYEIKNKLTNQEIRELAIMKKERNIEKKKKEYEKFSVMKRIYSLAMSIYKRVFKSTYDEANESMHDSFGTIIEFYEKENLFGYMYVAKDMQKGKLSLRALQVCIDNRYEWYSPGMICINQVIRDIIDKKNMGDVKVLDLTCGADKYKYDIGAKEHYNYNFYATQLPQIS